MGKRVIMVVVIMVVHTKGRNGEMIKRAGKIALEMALVLLSLMESGTCCEIKAADGTKPIPQDYMESTKPIHKCFCPNHPH